MKKLVVLAGLVIVMAIACNTDSRTKLPQSGTYGVAFDTSNATAAEDIDAILNISNDVGLKATGTIAQYCKGEGCWLTLKNKQGAEVLVNVKDKKFVLPYNIEGKTAYVNGMASRDTTEDGSLGITIEADGIVLR